LPGDRRLAARVDRFVTYLLELGELLFGGLGRLYAHGGASLSASPRLAGERAGGWPGDKPALGARIGAVLRLAEAGEGRRQRRRLWSLLSDDRGRGLSDDGGRGLSDDRGRGL